MFSFLFEFIYLYLSIPLIICFLYIRKSGKEYKLPPGPKGWPFIGNIPDPHIAPLHYEQLMNEWKDKYGYVVRFKRFGTNLVYVSDYKLAVQALTQTFPNELSGRVANSMERNSVGGQHTISVASLNPAWVELRKQVMIVLKKAAEPGKMTDISNQAYDLFAKHVREHKELLETDEMYLTYLMYWLSHNMMVWVFFKEGDEYNDPDYQDSVEAFNQILLHYSKLYHWEGTQLNVLPHPSKQQMLKYSKHLTDKIKVIMDKRRENGMYKSDPTFGIDYFMQLQDRQKEKDEKLANLQDFSDWYISNLTLDIYIGGTEAISVGFLWTVGLLATHPDAQVKIRKELNDMAETTGEPFNPKWMDRLHYLKAVIYEVFRIATFSPFSILHRALSDVKIGEYDIPKDTLVAVNIHGIHRDPRYWKDAYEFVPERFLNEEGKFQLPKEGFMAFGVGKRTCVAERYTVKESHFIFTGRLCQDFQLVWSSKNESCKMEEDKNNNQVTFAKPFRVQFIPLS